MRFWKWVGFIIGAVASLLLEVLLMPLVLVYVLSAFVASFFKEREKS
jgi:hypothetical protein